MNNHFKALLSIGVLLGLMAPVIAESVPPFLGPITGNFATGIAVPINSLSGQSVCSTVISGSGGFTATFLVSNNGTSFIAAYTVDSAALTQVTTASANGRFITFLGAAKSFEVLPGTITGTVSYSITCSIGNVPLPGSGGGGSTPSPLPTFPWPVVFPSAQPVTLINTPAPFPTQPFKVVPNTTVTPAAQVTMSASTSSVVLFAGNSALNGFTVCNSSTSDTWFNFGATASSSSFWQHFPPYNGAAKFATQTATLANTPNHDGTVTTTVNGNNVVYTEVSGDTDVTILAGHVINAINTDGTVDLIVTASNNAGVITLTSNTAGTSGNSITLTTAITDTSTTYTAGGATLTGGTDYDPSVVETCFTMFGIGVYRGPISAESNSTNGFYKLTWW